MSAATESERIARFAVELKIKDIPPEVLTLAKQHLLDTLGIALASTRFDFGRVVLAGAQKLGRGDEASAIGSGTALPAASAALVNGVLAHGLDFDDTHIGSVYHASAQAMAASFAAGQAAGASGAEVLVAFVAALEIGCRLASAAAGKFHERGLHPTALCGTFASAIAAGRLNRLDAQQMAWALGICGTQAGGILERGSSWLKRLNPGWAAHSGMAAVALAGAGFSGPETVFEGVRGFYASHIGSIPEGAALPSLGLGRDWQSLGIALKPYPCCHFIHSFVDAALELRGQFALEDVERIDCPLTATLHKSVAEPRERCIRPQTIYSALFSVPYVVVLALVRGKVDLAAFYDEPLDRPEVLAITERTWCRDDPQSDYPLHFPGEVLVTLKDGRVLRSRKPCSLGTPEVPLSKQAVEEKFMSNATRAIDAGQAAQLIECVDTIETQPALAALMALCTARAD